MESLGLTYLYYLQKFDDEYCFVISSTVTREEPAELMEAYDVNTPEATRAIETHTVQIGEEPYTDK